LDLVIGCAVLPVLIFAVFLLEAGAPERDLQPYPFVFLGCAAALASQHTKRFRSGSSYLPSQQWAAVNINAMRESTLDREHARAASRIRDSPSIVGAYYKVAMWREGFP